MVAKRSGHDDASTVTVTGGRMRRLAYDLRRPLAAVFVLAAGIALFTSAPALLGRSDGQAYFQVVRNDARDDGGNLHVLPLPEREFAAALARLKDGPFGVDLKSPDGAILVSGQAFDELEAAVVVDATQPPLRVAIMGLDQTLRGLPPAPAGEAAAP